MSLFDKILKSVTPSPDRKDNIKVKKSIIRKIPGFRTGKLWKMVIASFFYLLILIAIFSPSDDNIQDNTKTSLSSNGTTSEITTENNIETVVIAENLKGRGSSDYGRSEPHYIGIKGYVVIPYSLEDKEAFTEIPWTVPIYKKDKQFYIENGVVEHKTEVTVKEQKLEHKGWGTYSGYLLVERNDNKEQFYINVVNFITKPYWTYNNLSEAALVGDYIAEYHQSSDYYPVNRDDKKVDLDDGIKVLVISSKNSNTNPIEALVFKEWQYGYGGVSVFFDEQDLSIIY